MVFLIILLSMSIVAMASPMDFMAITDTPEPSPAFELRQMDVLDYALEFYIGEGTSTFVWSVEIEFVNLVEDATEYYFDLMGADFPYCPTVFRYDYLAGVWRAVTARYEDSLFVVEAGPFPVGETVKFAIPGRPTPYGTGIYRDLAAGEYWTHSLLWPSLARYAFPCIDHPADRATCTMRIIAPEGQTVAGGGVFVDSVASETYDGYTEWTFRYDEPVCTYNISFAVGNYATIETTALDGTLPVKSYAYPSRLMQTEYDFARIPQIMALWDSLFGAYPYPTIGCVVVPLSAWGGGGAMEHQMLPQIGDVLITGTRAYEKIIAHELAHQWFGDCVGIADWADFWLNEGIAKYSEVLWTEHIDGAGPARTYMTTIQNGYRNWTLTNEDFPIFDPASYLSPVPYHKGACWWHMLRWQLGDDDFFAFLRNYTDRFKFRTVVTDSLQTALEDFTGAGWSAYFDEWVYGQGYPRYLFDEIIGRDSTGWWVDIDLRQAQELPSCTLFTSPVPVEIITPESTYAEIIRPTSRRHVQRFFVPDSIEYIHLDRTRIILGTFTFSPSNIAEKAPLPESMSIFAYPNPFNSTVRITIDGVVAIHELPLQIEIFDVAGRQVAEIPVGEGPRAFPLDGNSENGSAQGRSPTIRQFIWHPDASLPSGVYLVRARFGSAQRPSGGRTAAKRVMYLK